MEKLEAKLRSCLRFAQIRSEIRGNPKPQVTVRWLLKLWQRQRGICPIFHLKMTMKGSLGVTLAMSKTRRNTCTMKFKLGRQECIQPAGEMAARGG